MLLSKIDARIFSRSPSTVEKSIMLAQIAERLAVFLRLLDKVTPDREFAYEVEVSNGVRSFQILGVGAQRFIVILDTSMGSEDSVLTEDTLREALLSLPPHVSTIAVSVTVRSDLMAKHVVPFVTLPCVFAPMRTTVQVLSESTIMCFLTIS